MSETAKGIYAQWSTDIRVLFPMWMGVRIRYEGQCCFICRPDALWLPFESLVAQMTRITSWLTWEVYSSARRICRGWIRREIIIWIVNLLIFTVPAKLNVKGGDSPTLQGTETRISGGNRTWTRGCSTTPSVKFYTSHIWTEQTRNERPPCAIGATWDRPVKGLFLYPSHLRTHHRLCLATFVNLRSPSAWVSWMELSWHGKGLKSTTQTMKRYVSRCRTYRKIAMWKAGSDNRRPRSSTFSLIVFIRVR